MFILQPCWKWWADGCACSDWLPSSVIICDEKCTSNFIYDEKYTLLISFVMKSVPSNFVCCSSDEQHEKRFSCVFNTSPVFPLFVAVVVVSVLIMYCLFWLLLILVYTYCFFPFHNNFCDFQTQVCMAFDFLISVFAFVLLFLRLIFPVCADLFLFFFCLKKIGVGQFNQTVFLYALKYIYPWLIPYL